MKVENLIKLIPLGTIILTLISGIKLAIYYKQFQIQIFDFIELKEIITLFFDDILYYISTISVVLIIYLIITSFSNFRLSKEPNTERIKDQTKEDKTLGRHINFIGIMAIVILVGLSGLIYFSDYSLYLKVSMIKSNVFIFLTLGLVVSAYKGWIKNLNAILTLYLGIITIGFLTIEGFLEAQKVKSNINKQVFEIRTTEKIYQQNQFSYIGKSNRYIFLYNTKENSSLILPISKLDSFTLNGS